jgi:hypothetical protein
MEPDDDSAYADPPADPNEWTDEEWIAWLKATDGAADDLDGTEEPTAPTTAMGRLARSSGGQVLGQAMLGLAQAIYGVEEDEVVHVAEGSTEADPEEPFTVHLDPDDPARSTVVFRSDAEPEAEQPG